MRCEQVRAALADYLAGDLDPETRSTLEAHLAGCECCREEAGSLQGLWSRLSCLPEVEPTRASAKRFEAMLQAYGQGLKQGRRETSRSRALGAWLGGLWPRQPAVQFAVAIGLFAAGLLAGGLSWRLGPRQAAGAGGDAALAQLRAEVVSMKQLVMLSLLEQPSASERLRGVAWANELARPGEPVLAALLRALESDPNVNVRLAVVSALRPFAGEAPVRRGLLESLGEQTSPLVQVELIHLLVELKAKESIPRLRALLQRQALNPTVRERVEWGLANLG